MDVAPDFGLIGVDGVASPRINAIGPFARAAFWECIAIPDIRVQCAALVEALAAERNALSAAPARRAAAASI